VAALVDTNILVYCFDDRDPKKQAIAVELIERGIDEDSLRIPHQALLEFIAATTRPVRGHVILPQAEALRAAGELLLTIPVLYPNESILRSAFLGWAGYQLNWFDAHLWAYAEHYGLNEILTEDFQHNRLYGTVRAVNPFINAGLGSR
jgi:predicted nucleic acid-binding protein